MPAVKRRSIKRRRGPKCTTCEHLERAKIERWYLEGATVRSIARMYGIPPSSLDHHFSTHVKPELTRIKKDRHVSARDNLIDTYFEVGEALSLQARQYVDDAKSAVTFVKSAPKKWTKMRDIAAMGPALQAARGIHELVGRSVKILGEQQLGPSQPFVLIIPESLAPARPPSPLNPAPASLEAGVQGEAAGDDDEFCTIDVKAIE